jgi:hypothetical protein
LGSFASDDECFHGLVDHFSPDMDVSGIAIL